MKQSMSITVPGGGIIQIEANDEKELIRSASFWMSIPDKCGYKDCGADVRFFHLLTRNGHNYYGLLCKGKTQHRLDFGQHKKGNDLFCSGKAMWDIALFNREDFGEFDESENQTPQKTQPVEPAPAVATNVTPIRQPKQSTAEGWTEADRKNSMNRINGFCSKMRANGGTPELPPNIPRRSWSEYSNNDLYTIETAVSGQWEALVKELNINKLKHKGAK